MRHQMALPWLALLAMGACSGRDATGPTISSIGPRSAGSRSAGASDDSHRSGDLHLTKDCVNTYFGGALDFCTITESNVEQIKLGSRVVYQTAAGATSLNSDVILYPPHSGENIVFGHCALAFATGLGHCTFSGGTGKFKAFTASVTVTCVAGICALDGTYSFKNND